MALELGLVMPGVTVRDDLALPRDAFIIRLHGHAILGGRATRDCPDRLLRALEAVVIARRNALMSATPQQGSKPPVQAALEELASPPVTNPSKAAPGTPGAMGHGHPAPGAECSDDVIAPPLVTAFMFPHLSPSSQAALLRRLSVRQLLRLSAAYQRLTAGRKVALDATSEQPPVPHALAEG